MRVLVIFEADEAIAFASLQAALVRGFVCWYTGFFGKGLLLHLIIFEVLIRPIANAPTLTKAKYLRKRTSNVG